MGRNDDHSRALDDLAARLSAEGMEPDGARTWSDDDRAEARSLHVAIEAAIAALRDAGLDLSVTPSERVALISHATGIASEVVALLRASGSHREATALLRSTRSFAEGDALTLADAAVHEPGKHGELMRSRWLRRRGRLEEADELLREVATSSREEALRAAAIAELGGAGASARPKRLGGAAKLWALAVLVVLMAIPVALWIDHYLSSPEHLAAVATEEAWQIESHGDAVRARERYQAILERYSERADRASLAPAATGFVRAGVHSVVEPMVIEGVDEASELVLRYESLPQVAQGGEAATLLVSSLVRWADQIGSSGPLRGEAALRLLDLAGRVAESHDHARVAEAQTRYHMAVGRSLARDWPTYALSHFLAAETGEEGTARASDILQSLLPSPSLLLETEPSVRRWARRPGIEEDLRDRILTSLRQARAATNDAGRLAALDSGDQDALRAVLARSPSDQTIRAVVADLRRGAGDFHGAIRLLEEIGTAGRMTGDAQLLYATCLADADRLPEADAVLTRYVAARVPAFQEAQRALEHAEERLGERLVARARAGRVPAEVAAEIAAAPPAQVGKIITPWMRSELDADEALGELRDEVNRHIGVVSASLTLGTLKLRRATASPGPERQRLLAEAERCLLSVRQEAEGVPTFHLGLGQIYYRLGKRDEAEAQLGAVLARHEPELDLAVARAYRELGMMRRAREVATSVFERGESPALEQAALMLATMADSLDDEQRWLERVPAEHPGVAARLLHLRARRMLQEGRLEEADRSLALVAAEYERDASIDPAAANNAALVYQQRYLCTGDPAHLRRALLGLDNALRLLPDSSLTLGNAAVMLRYDSNLRVLDRWVRTGTLRMEERQAAALVDSVASGPLRDEVIASLLRDASAHRSLELTRQEQVLAPRRAWAYEQERERLSLVDDSDGLAALLGRIERAGDLDTTREDDLRVRWQQRSDEAQARRDASAAVDRATAILTGTRRSRHDPTIAAALLLLAQALMDRVDLGGGAGDARSAVEALREGQRLWPELGCERALAWALVTVAVREIMEEAGGLRDRWTDEGRVYRIDLFLHRATSGDGGAALLGVLRRRPEMQEGASLLSMAAAREPNLGDWLLGTIAGDPQLASLAEPARSRADKRLSQQIRARLAPGDADALERLALLAP